MKRSVILDYKDVSKDWGTMDLAESNYNIQDQKHTYPNGSFVEFLGVDKADVGKGVRRDLIYINEANKMTFDEANNFVSRADITIIDYNPDEKFWGDSYIKSDGSNFLRLTYLDNEFLRPTEIGSILFYKKKGFKNSDLDFKDLFHPDNIVNKWFANKWKVNGLGLIGMLEGVVFENWSKIQSIPQGAELLAYGIDWGFSIDPTTLVEVYRWNGKLVINERIYQTGLLNHQLISLMNQLGIRRDVIIICDSADPKSIQELRNAGYYAMPCTKGQDSVTQGISKLQEFELLITEASYNTIKEFENYTWKKNANNESIGIPVDAFNHSIDPIRYIAYTEMNPKPTIEL